RAAALGADLRDLDLRQLPLGRLRRQLVLELLAQFLGELLGPLALGVGGAAQEQPARPLADHHRAFALVAGDAEVGLLDRFALGVELLGVAALGVAGAAEETPARSLPDHHRLAALVALVAGRFDDDDRLALAVEVHARVAFGMARAAQERGIGVPFLL